MHYYSFNIGDYTSHTAHLTPLEDIAYRRLLDLYYQTESPISKDLKAVCRHVRMRDNEAEVALMLSEFFSETDDGWVSHRCEREIADYKQKAGAARINGRKGGRPKKQTQTQQEPGNNPAGFSSFSNGNPDQTQDEPSEKLTINHKPITNNQEPIPPIAPDGGGVGFDLPEPHDLPRQQGGNGHPLAGVVCKAIKLTGIGLVNPGHPKLNALLHGGVSVEQVVDACRRAVDKRKTFTYALGILEREEADARSVAQDMARPKLNQPGKPEHKSFAQQEREAGWARWEAMTNEIHPDRLASQVPMGNRQVIDITPYGDQQLIEG